MLISDIVQNFSTFLLELCHLLGLSAKLLIIKAVPINIPYIDKNLQNHIPENEK